MTERVTIDGIERIAAVLPDPKCPVNKGNHSPRGGTMGRDLVSVARPFGDHLDSVKERLTTPWLRTSAGWEPLTPDEAFELVARLVLAATDARKKDGTLHFTRPSGLGVKLFEYGSLENTYAATKLFFRFIGTPNVAFHDRPSVASNTQGFDDSGMDAHGYNYADIWSSDVLFLAGSNPYETQSVFFMQQMTGKRIIVLDPRRTITADYAEKTGGLHLQPTVLGADVAVINALCHYIVTKRCEAPAGWGRARFESLQASGMLKAQGFHNSSSPVPNYEPYCGPDDGRKKRNLMTYAEFVKFLDEEELTLEKASDISGIPLEKLKEAARLLSGTWDEITHADEDSVRRKDPARRKVSLIFEKGLIWGYSYHSTAAMANLGLLLGSALRKLGKDTHTPGANDPRDPLDHNKRDPAPLGVTGRAGGHQKGWALTQYKAANDGQERELDYPFYNSTDYFEDDAGWKFWTHHYLDPHLVGTAKAKRQSRAYPREQKADVRLLWIVGANPAGQMADAGAKWDMISRRRGGDCAPVPIPGQSRDKYLAAVAAHFIQKRIQNNTTPGSDDLVIIQQDIYPNPTTHYADLVLPAKGWGEHDFTRYSGERRLRLYGRFQDSPKFKGNDRCLEDWKIFAEVAKKIFALKNNPSHGHGLPDAWTSEGWHMADSLNRDGFGWANAEAVFEELSQSSNQHKNLGVVATGSGESPYGWLRNRGSLGVVLPATTTNDEIVGSDRRIPDTGSYAFVRCSWKDLAHHFSCDEARWADDSKRSKTGMGRLQMFDPATDEFYICNGRINELWNSLFTHIRNETIRQRYPDDMSGTILEIHPEDARDLEITDGDVIAVSDSCNRQFKGVAIIQGHIGKAETQPLPRGMVFVYFSYPVNVNEAGPFASRNFEKNCAPFHDGYVNNITTDYVDPINPIAAVKFARGRITKTGRRYAGMDLPRYEQRPSTAQRHVAFAVPKLQAETERLNWQIRELIVQLGLPRMSMRRHRRVADLIRDPDRFIKELKTNKNGVRDDFLDALGLNPKYPCLKSHMVWTRRWPTPADDDEEPLDQWTPAARRLVAEWRDSLPT